MKIDVMMADAKVCTLQANIDLKQAIAMGEEMTTEQFNILFSQSVLAEIMELRDKGDEGMTILYRAIADYAADKYKTYLKKQKKKDTQERFNGFFDQFLVSDVKFIPLVHE